MSQQLNSREPVTDCWKPAHRSTMAELIWLNYGSGLQTAWCSGELVFGSPSQDDKPFLPIEPSADIWRDLPLSSAPPWVSEQLEALDLLLPDSETIAACLDADSLTIPEHPPALRIPHIPREHDAGRCLAASRVLLSCTPDLIPPVFTSNDQAASMINHASCLAVMLGGHGAVAIAAEILTSRSSFMVQEDSRDDLHEIRFGEVREC